MRQAVPKKTAPTFKKTFGRTQADAPLSLPFWDDFSFTHIDDTTTTANQPLDSLWTTNSKDVWINNGVGVNPPSLNVATFDGLNALGSAYSNISTANGLRDSLTSRPIDLSETGVSLAERNSVFLSFSYQWQGNGEPPDATDFLRLQFKGPDNKWETMITISPKSTLSRTEFYDTIVQVLRPGNDARYFHKYFQFRIENFGKKSGPFDTWNVDYIYLNKNRSFTKPSFPDRAIASGTSQLFGKYRDVVLDHFFEQKTLKKVEFDVKNNKLLQVENATTYTSSFKFRKIKKDSSVTSFTLNTVEKPVGGGILGPGERVHVVDTIPDANDLQQFSPDNLRIDITYKVDLSSNDNTDLAGPLFLPIDFQINDTISSRYTMADYYAYDDGTAEYSASLLNATDRGAYGFDMLTSETDTLVGFDINIMDYSITSANSQIVFYVYDDDGGKPALEPRTGLPYNSKLQGGLNRFQRVYFGDEIVPVKNRFYIGWAGIGVAIGLDCTNNTVDQMFQNIDEQNWEPADVPFGSLMIRPLLGKAKAKGPTLGVPEFASIFLYPNPNHGEFYLPIASELLTVLNATGQPINFSTVPEQDRQRIMLPSAAPGLYLLKIRQQQTIVTKKIIVHP